MNPIEELKQMAKDARAEAIQEATPEERVKGLSAAERLKGLSLAERLKGLSVAELVRALPPEILEALTRQLKTNKSSSKLP